MKPYLRHLGKGGWLNAAYLMFHDGQPLSYDPSTSLPVSLCSGAGLRLRSGSPLHAVFAHFGTQRSTTWGRQDSVSGRAFHKLSNNLPSRACTPALPQQQLSSYFSCIVMLNNAVKEVKNLYLLFLCPKSLLGLDYVCAEHYQLVTDMFASTIAF